MKTAAHQRQLNMAEDIQANLRWLNAKYARRLEKPLVNTVRKLSRKFSKLLDKYSKVRNRKATRAAAKFLVKRLRKSFQQLGTAPLPTTAKRKALRPA